MKLKKTKKKVKKHKSIETREREIPVSLRMNPASETLVCGWADGSIRTYELLLGNTCHEIGVVKHLTDLQFTKVPSRQNRVLIHSLISKDGRRVLCLLTALISADTGM